MSERTIAESKQISRQPTTAEYKARKEKLVKENRMGAWRAILDSVPLELLDEDGKAKHALQLGKYEKTMEDIERLAISPVVEWQTVYREQTDEEVAQNAKDQAAFKASEKAMSEARKERKKRVKDALTRANLTLADVRDIIEELNDGGQ